MDDYISREAAIMVAMDYDGQGNAQDASQDIASGLVELPAADVRPVARGTWMIGFGYPNPTGTYCSKCGFAWSEQIAAVTLEPVLSRIETNFCPNCGAHMGDDSDAISKD